MASTPRPEDDIVSQQVSRPRPEDDLAGKSRRPRPEDDKASSDGPLLRVVDLKKSYDQLEALKGISFELYRGDIMGFLGPNGAGKTTALRILATIIKPTSGTAEIDGCPIDDVDHARRKMGYMPDFIGTYDELTVNEYMEFFARAYLVPKDMREFAKNEALSTTGLTELADRPVKGLSRGQSQRLALARLLMHDPPILLLDEPAAGLDPRARVHLRDILRELQRKGKAIIVSSHVLEDLAELSNKIAVIDQGRLLAFGQTQDLMHRLRDSRRWKIRMRDQEEMERLRVFLESHPDVSEVAYEGPRLLVTFSGGEEVTEQVHETLFKEGFRLLEFAEEDLGLEELYLRITSVSTP
jgi:ABC-2 type transport system ATP-binding protein